MTAFTSPMTTLLTIEEVATYFSVSPQTIRRWVKNNNFAKPEKIGRRLLWNQDEILKFLAENKI